MVLHFFRFVHCVKFNILSNWGDLGGGGGNSSALTLFKKDETPVFLLVDLKKPICSEFTMKRLLNWDSFTE